MDSYRFAQVPSNTSIASLVSLVVSAWFVLAGAAMLAEPSTGEQARALQAKTPVVTVRQVFVTENVEGDEAPPSRVAAERAAGRVS